MGARIRRGRHPARIASCPRSIASGHPQTPSSPNHTGKGHSDDHHTRGTIPSPRDRVTRITPELDDAPAPEQPPHRELARRELAAYAARIHLTDLVREHGSPLFVLDVDRVTTQLLALRRELPEAQIHFATKSLPHPAVIRAVDAFGASFEVASRGEVDLLEREGVAIGRCLHTHRSRPSPTSPARTCGASAPSSSTTPTRWRSSGACRRTSRCWCACRSRTRRRSPTVSSKSGIAPEEAGGLVAHCLRAGLRVSGFTFHVGSQTVSAAPWVHAIRRTLALMRRLEHAHGIRFDTLDLGGGFPVGYDEPAPSLAELARGIRAALSAAPKRYRILIEPGRFVSAPAMTL